MDVGDIKFKPKKHATGILAQVEGRYLGEVKIDGIPYFTFNKDLPY